MKCPHGWTIAPPDFRCPQKTCPTNATREPDEPEVRWAHGIRWRMQNPPGQPWSEWHRLGLMHGITRITRCRVSVDVGPASVERGAVAFGVGEGKCGTCFV